MQLLADTLILELHSLARLASDVIHSFGYFWGYLQHAPMGPYGGVNT